ncbi:hypothetical protein [Cryobacterium sp. AP23]
MSRVSIVLDLAAHEYRALAAIADNRGIQSHVLVEQLVRHALATPPKPRMQPAPIPEPVTSPKPKPKYVPKPMPKRSRAMIRRDRDEQFVSVAKLHGQGLTDGRIAAQLGVSAGTVFQRRNQLHLPPVTKRGRPRNAITKPESEAI